MKHSLKTIQPYFNQVGDDLKTFEIRKTDRPYRVGDTLILQEYDPVLETYSGKQISREVTSVLINAPDFGLMDGYCIMSIKPLIP